MGESKPSLCVDLLAGFVSGATCKLYEHPFDTIKVLMQVNPKGVYRNSFDCLKKTVSLYGFKGLFRGLQFPLIGSVAENGLTFVSYSFCKRCLGVTESEQMTLTQMVLSGMGSGVCISFLLTPVELLKCNLQIEQSFSNSPNPKKLTTMGVIRKVVREGGFNGLFRGLNVTLLREIPGTMIWFVAYELALRCFKQPGHSRNEVSLWGIFSAGAISGATYWSLIYPIDTVKSIMQTDPKYSSQIQQGKSRLASTSKYLVRLVRSLGLKGLYSGLGFTMFRAIPTNAILFLSYEYSARLFSKFF